MLILLLFNLWEQMRINFREENQINIALVESEPESTIDDLLTPNDDIAMQSDDHSI